ncbi:MAG: glycosyltransferase family 4 protein [Planctomycetota bacterium]|jgi:glycosyltransferase involved in cell wall biosynthesis
MANETSKKVAFVSSYLPRRCGIATFCNDLTRNISACAGNAFEPLVVAMVSSHEHQYSSPVKFEIRKNVKNDYVCAADYLNFSHVDLVSVQHEFGLFGGSAGAYLNLLLKRIDAPVITTLHTILNQPALEYRQSMIDVCELSEKIIVMNVRGVSMLRNIYGVDSKKIQLIPHGIPDLPFVDSSYYKHKFGIEGRKTILTFGLLSRNKGIEHMLKTLPAIVETEPDVLYIILGATHPDVLRHDGEEYRFELQRIVEELGLQDNVMFYNQFVSDERLHNFLCATDIYVTPYQNKEQLTSGTLAFAVGSGKAVVSTPYWAAEELLDEGRGRIVAFNDHKGLSDAIIGLLKDESVFNECRRRAYDYGRTRTWPKIGQQYWDLFSKARFPGEPITKTFANKKESISLFELPEPSLDHLRNITDDTGLIQHAKFMLPDREHGYCTDDNARAVVAMVKYHTQYADPEALRLFNIYLSFILHAQRKDGTFHNFMDYNRQWVEPEPAHDGLGRSLWAFGSVIEHPPLPELVPILKDLFDKSSPHIPQLPLRGKAYAIFGMRSYLSQFPGASDIKRYLHAAAEHLVYLFEKYSEPGWDWFENTLAYDNAVLPHALFDAYITTGKEIYLEIATKSCEFLLETTFTGEHFSFVGCNGWYPKGGQKAQFDQQALEAVSTAMMLRGAYKATDNPNYLKMQKKAFGWFLGDNDLSIPIYDFRTKGCCDGLETNGTNLNQGAESMISFLLALLSVIESYSPQRHNGSDPKQNTLSVSEPDKTSPNNDSVSS